MTAKCQVLGVGSDGSYYESSVNVNYWDEGGSAPGRWFGEGARDLGLRGNVRPHAVADVLAGRHPGTSQFLLPSMQHSRARDRSPSSSGELEVQGHRPGFDLQFAAPKSVSAAWATASLEVRKKIEACMDRAIRATLSSLESRVPLARRIEGGILYRETAKLVVAMYDHVTSRSGDPHLHRHCVIANVCRRDDGEWRTIDSRSLHRWSRALGPLFRANLAHELRSHLGFSLVRGRDESGRQREWFEIEGVPRQLLGEWSTRRRSILSFLSPSHRRAAKSREFAALKTRPDKEELIPRKELFSCWQQHAAKHGLTPDTVQSLCQRSAQEYGSGDERFQEAWQRSLKELTVSHAWFTERNLIQCVTEKLQTGHLAGKDIERRIQDRLNLASDIVPLRQSDGDRNFTTREMWELENQFLKSVEAMRSRTGASVSLANVERILTHNPRLDTEQRDAVKALLTENSAVRVLSGVAGSGKSTTLKSVREGFERQGYRVFGGAISGVARDELTSKTGMTARTIASYLYHLDRSMGQKLQDRLSHDARQLVRAAFGLPTRPYKSFGLDSKSVLILDEAGMLGTRALQRILFHAERSGATVVLAGDNKQLQPIEAGGPFSRLLRDMKSSHLSVNRRQQDPADREAVQQLRDGNVADAIRNYAQRGRIQLGQDRRDAITELVRTWEHQGGYRAPQKHAIYTQTRAEASIVNDECQKVRLRRSLLPSVVHLTHEGVDYRRGDRILFHRGAAAYRIENGQRGTVVSVNPILRTLKIRIDRSEQQNGARAARSSIVTISMRDFRDRGVSLGYAFTTHKGQGTTVDHSYVLTGGFQVDREMLYVQATRARCSTHFFLSRDDAGPNLTRIIESARQSRERQMAHDRSEQMRHQSPQQEH